jgi:hypothetical protein
MPAALRRSGRVDHDAPVGWRICGLLEDKRRIGLVHADFDCGGLLPTDRVEEALSERNAPRGVNDEVSSESPLGSADILEPHTRDAAIVRRGDQLGDAGAGSQFDIRSCSTRWRQTRSSAGRDGAN